MMIKDLKHGQLVEALRQVQSVCPPRPSRQSKAHLLRCINGALECADGSPVKVAMQAALESVR